MVYIKYPRTFHLPWSEGATRDDLILDNVDHFKNKLVVITEKMDGECTTLYPNYIHARSIMMNNHPSRDWVKNFHAQIKHNIPKGWRICGENLFATHSIHYRSLDSYFLGFSTWTQDHYALDWEETCEYFDLLGISPVPILWSGIFDEEQIRHLGSIWTNNPDVEGYVVRLAPGFYHQNFDKSIAKWVRKGHVQTDEHWMSKQIIPNELKEKQ